MPGVVLAIVDAMSKTENRAEASSRGSHPASSLRRDSTFAAEEAEVGIAECGSDQP
jgi:hypothetical protein